MEVVMIRMKLRNAGLLFIFIMVLFDGSLYASSINIPGTTSVTVGFAATTYGQTFLLPSPIDTLLTQFSLTFLGSGQYHAFIYEWNGNTNGASGNPVGTALFDSGAFNAPASKTQVFFNTPGIGLDPAKGYVAFINATSLFGYEFDVNVFNPYPDGLGPTRTTNPNFLTAGSWSSQDLGSDLAFTATFVTAAELPAVFTLALGVLLIGLSYLRITSNLSKRWGARWNE